MEKQNNSVGKTALIVLLLIVTIISLVLATFAWARYTTTINGEATAQVAKWNVSGNMGDSMFSQEFDYVIPERLAPGTSGTIGAKLEVTGTEVDVDYTIRLVSVEAINGAQIPTNLKIFAADGTTVIYCKAEGKTAANAVIKTGTIATGDASKVLNTSFNWSWAYQTGDVKDTVTGETEGDAQDTLDGQTPAQIKITYSIEAHQKQPQPKA